MIIAPVFKGVNMGIDEFIDFLETFLKNDRKITEGLFDGVKFYGKYDFRFLLLKFSYFDVTIFLSINYDVTDKNI